MKDEQQGQRLTLKFRYEPSSKVSKYFVQYLQALEQDTGESPKDLLLRAGRLCFLPQALKHFGAAPDHQLRQAAAHSISMLMWQACLLAQEFDLPYPWLQSGVASPLEAHRSANHNGHRQPAEPQASVRPQETEKDDYTAHLAEVDAEVNSLLEGIDEILP